MWRDAALVAGKDLRIELRSRVALNQVAPFAVLVLVLFAFALDPDRDVLVRAAAGTLYGVLAAGLRVRETLLPLLLLPVVAPVLIAATRASEAALTGLSLDVTPGDWLRLLTVFAVIYVAFGVVAYGALMEDS